MKKTSIAQINLHHFAPDKTFGIGNYTRADFHRALKDGIAKGKGNLYPAMPFVFTHITAPNDFDAQNKRPYRLGENNFEIKEIDMPSMVFIDKQLLIDKDALYYCSISIDDSPYDYNRRYNDQELNPVIVNSIQ